MSNFDAHLPACDHEADAGAYALRALSPAEALAFETHLESCTTCAREVAELRGVVDQLPMAAPQFAPAPALKDRIMRVVDAEASLLAATGPEADRVPAPQDAEPRRSWLGWLTQRPAFAAVGAACLVAVGVAGGVVATNDPAPSTHTVAAQVTNASGTAKVSYTGGRAALHLSRFSAPPAGQVYQVWLVGKDGKPVPTHTLFNVRQDGNTTVEVQEPVKGYSKMLVTAEQSGGALKPTGTPVIAANI